MTPKGFRFATVEAAVKKPGRKDLALIFSETPAAVAAVYTTNKVTAAPVQVSRARTAGGTAQAIVVNSGNANACTGQRGLDDAIEFSRLVAEGLGTADEAILPSSTGVIGVPLPMDRMRAALPALIENLEAGTLDDVAAAIMTTDTFPKIEHREIVAGGVTCRISGIAKGAGMIMPNMATMLAFIVTDAAIDPAFLAKLWPSVNDSSFNAVSVDGDTSTNDTSIILANGAAGNLVIHEGTPEGKLFEEQVSDLLLALAKKIVKDGEGATKFVTIQVDGAVSNADAKKAAMAIANSMLVKTAFFGQDANWGRIFAAVGYSGADVDQSKLELLFDDVQMARDGLFTGGDAEERGSAVLRKQEFTVTIRMNIGTGSSTVYTSDLSHEYVSINADYRT